MAPPVRRKHPSSASSSSSSPIPLPGVALGLFAAIAAGFAASRALRKKRHVSLQDQAISAGKDSVIPLLVQDREIEIKEKDDSKSSPLVVINGTIAISHEPAKLELKPVFEAFEEENKNGANAAAAAPGGEEEEEVKRAEADEEGELREGEGEPMEITIEVEASVVVEGASMKALQETSLVEEGEEDGDDERLAEQPSPVLINGKALDLNEEMADSEEDHDLLSNRSNSLSDAFSESSLQEVSSAPVKPLPAEETPINWPETKPDFVVAEEEAAEAEEVLEDKNWPEIPDLKQSWPDLKQNLPDLRPVSVEKDGKSLDLKLVLAGIKEEGASAEKLNQINYEVISGLVDVKGASAEKLNQLKEEGVFAEKLNYEVISKLVDVKGDYVVLECEVSVDVGLGEAVRINGKVTSDEQPEIKSLDFPQPDEPSTCKDIANGEPNLQLAQEGTDTDFSTNGETNLQSTEEGCDDNKGLRTHSEPILHERTTEHTGLSDTSGGPLEEPANGDPLEEPVLQSHGQNLDSVDTNIDIIKNKLDADNLQSTQEGCDDNIGLRTNGEPNLQLAQERTTDNGDPLEEPVLQSRGKNLDSVDDTSVDNTVNNLDAEKDQPRYQSFDDTSVDNTVNNLDTEKDQPSSPIAITEAKACEKEVSSGTKSRDDDGPDEPRRAKGKPRIQLQEIEELTRSLDISEQIIESRKLESFTFVHNNKAHQLVSSAIAQEAGLQSEGDFQSKIHKFAPYLPLEMSLICLLIGLVSFVLWYLGFSSSGQE